MTADRQKLVRDAERLVARGKLNAAIEAYLAVLESDPDDTTTLNRVGDLYARLQRLGEAIELFKRAAEHFSDEGFIVKSIAIYRKILRLDPLQLEASESLADLQARQGLVQDARQQYLSVAEGYQRRDDTASVTAVHRKLVDLEPDDPAHRLHLAGLLKEQGQLLDAQAQYGAIAELLLAHDRVADALTVCREAFDLDHDNPRFVTDVVGELRKGGHEGEAEEFLEFVGERSPQALKIATELLEPQIEEVVAEAEDDESILDLLAAEPEQVEVEGADSTDEEAYVLELDDVETEPEIPELELVDEEEEEIDLEIDLEDFEPEPVAVVESEPAEAGEPEPAEIVADVAADAEGFKELLIEAEVLARYGLEDKATEKYEEVISLVPEHLDSHLRLIDLYLQQEQVERVAELAQIAARLAPAQNRQADWEELEKRLTEAEFEVSEGLVTAPELPMPPQADVLAFEPAQVEGGDDLSWLDEVPTSGGAASDTDDSVFESEAEFFDLATELERELDEEVGPPDEDLVTAPEEQSLEEIVEGFKKGMAETLSPEDFDTHYNLGIAYREMGLIDEAVSEFQLAARDPRYLVDCCSLLASCFIEKGFPELAIKWYNKGLSSPIITQDETLGLVYELGDLYLSIGKAEEARLRFVEIYGVNSDYRDVGSKLAQLDHS